MALLGLVAVAALGSACVRAQPLYCSRWLDITTCQSPSGIVDCCSGHLARLSVATLPTPCGTAPGRLVTPNAEAHGLFRYRRDEGGFAGWVEKRLKMSRRTALQLARRARKVRR